MQGLQIRLERFVLTQASNNYKNRTSSRSGAALAQSEELGKKNKKLKSRQREREWERERGSILCSSPLVLAPLWIPSQSQTSQGGLVPPLRCGQDFRGGNMSSNQNSLEKLPVGHGKGAQVGVWLDNSSQKLRNSGWITLRRNFEIPARLFLFLRSEGKQPCMDQPGFPNLHLQLLASGVASSNLVCILSYFECSVLDSNQSNPIKLTTIWRLPMRCKYSLCYFIIPFQPVTGMI